MVFAKIISLISFCAVLFIPAIQVQCCGTLDNDRNLGFYWDAASGNVHHYNVYLSEDGGPYFKVVNETEISMAPTENNPYVVPLGYVEYGKTYRLQVEASADASNVVTGPLSEPSDLVWCGQYHINLALGWNFISIPLQLTNNSLGDALQSIADLYSSIWTYDAAGGGWKRFFGDGRDRPDFLNNLTTIESGKGYWIQVTEPDTTLILDGARAANENISLKQGWNLIGYNCLTVRSPQEALASIAGNYDSVWTYDAASDEWKRYIVDGPGSLNNLEIMEPGKGYWIHAIDECTIIP